MDPRHLNEVCKFGQGEATCAFLMITTEGFACAKGTGIEPIIRDRLAQGTMCAKGDNCAGQNTAKTVTLTTSN